MPILSVEHLFEQADRLVGPPAQGAPRQADLRRAISSAYYALFHTIATQTADTIVGRTQRSNPLYALVYRRVDHNALRNLSEDVVKQTLPQKYKPYEPAGGFGADMKAVAAAIVDLQEKRHSADYDPLFRVRASDAVVTIALGRAAVTRFENTNATKRKAFLFLLLFAPRNK